MTAIAALLALLSPLAAPPPVQTGLAAPVAIHYRVGAMGYAASVHGLEWHRAGAGYVVNGQAVDGLASSPLCGWRAVGGTFWATVYNRRTGGWEKLVLAQADVSAPADRAAQLKAKKLLEVDYGTMYRLGSTIDQGWGRTPLYSLSVECGR